FIGLANFEYLFSSGLAWRMTFNTLIYNFIFIVGGTVLKVAIAIMFSEIAGKYYKKCVQTVTFLPHFISMVMVGTFAYNLLNYNSGVVNSLLVKLGLDKIDFYSTPNAWYVIIPLVDFWKGLGYGSIIYVSAITGISDDLYEAADLDGANFMQEILHITIPSIRPTIVILTLMSLGSIMKGNFDLFYQLVGEAGQLMETTEIIDTYVWRSLRQNVQIGMGSAAGLYQSFVGMVLVMVVNAIVKKIEPDYAIF
ncbi:MAG: ABC transporter permease subunit, partial [Christensenellales bacterium]|nr:ABC transporter permease subunit [Christensenellales bacterium]